MLLWLFRIFVLLVVVVVMLWFCYCQPSDWLRWLLWCFSPVERLAVKVVVVCHSLNGTAPRYLAADLRRLSDMPSRRRLRSSLTDQLDIRQSQCSAVGD